jgi:hypothetical protein
MQASTWICTFQMQITKFMSLLPLLVFFKCFLSPFFFNESPLSSNFIPSIYLCDQLSLFVINFHKRYVSCWCGVTWNLASHHFDGEDHLKLRITCIVSMIYLFLWLELDNLHKTSTRCKPLASFFTHLSMVILAKLRHLFAHQLDQTLGSISHEQVMLPLDSINHTSNSGTICTSNLLVFQWMT